jgi:V/A-type H+-transporting ATPase subunit I
MIIPMKKISIFTQAKDADGTLGELRSLGLLHVEHQQPPRSHEISALQDDLGLVSSALHILTQKIDQVAIRRDKEPHDWKACCRHIVESHKRLQQLEEFSRGMLVNMRAWQRWGNFDPAQIQGLKEKNIFIRLYQVSRKDLKGFPAAVSVEIVTQDKGMVYCAAISRGEIEVPFKEVPLPKMSLAGMRQRYDEDARVIRHIQSDLERHDESIPSLRRKKALLSKELEFHQALQGMGRQDQIMFIRGYAPQDKQGIFMEQARRYNWGILIEDPGPDDNVPTLLCNPKWVSVINPVFKLIEIIPGYQELDISPLFLLFLGLFFGMIIGDAGYGALYFFLTFILQRKFSRKATDKRVFFLFYFFSACAIAWGLLTGTVFGQEWYLKAGLKPLLPILNDTKFLQELCFFIGALHLTLAHLWQGLRKLPSLAAGADTGWICILWSAFFIARSLILSEPFPDFGRWLIIAGIALVVLCSNPQKNILKMLAQGLGALALSLVNNFTDVVSYVRLFAVGLAGIAISDTVNMLATSMGGNNAAAKALIIFLGHGINLMLGPLSVLVHGIRLNVLEFSGHANLSWSGSPYKPLQE